MKQDSECIFCKIVAGEVPCTKVLEDERALGFLDIGPVAEGHVLLIPKAHYLTADEMPAGPAGEVFRHIPALVRAVRAATGCHGVNVLQNNGEIAGQVVPHVHVHIIPRTPGGRFHFNWPAGTYPEGQMDALAERIRKNLEGF